MSQKDNTDSASNDVNLGDSFDDFLANRTRPPLLHQPPAPPHALDLPTEARGKQEGAKNEDEKEISAPAAILATAVAVPSSSSSSSTTTARIHMPTQPLTVPPPPATTMIPSGPPRGATIPTHAAMPRDSVLGHHLSTAISMGKQSLRDIEGSVLKGIHAAEKDLQHLAEQEADAVVAVGDVGRGGVGSAAGARRRGLSSTANTTDTIGNIGNIGNRIKRSPARARTSTIQAAAAAIISVERSSDDDDDATSTTESLSSSSGDDAHRTNSQQCTTTAITAEGVPNSNSGVNGKKPLKIPKGARVFKVQTKKQRKDDAATTATLSAPSSSTPMATTTTTTMLYYESHYLRDQTGRAYRQRKLTARHLTETEEEINRDDERRNTLRGREESDDVAAAAAGEEEMAAVVPSSLPPPPLQKAYGATLSAAQQVRSANVGAPEQREEEMAAAAAAEEEQVETHFFVGTDKDRFHTIRTLTKYPTLLGKFPLLSPLANTFGLLPTLALGICYFFGKGLGSHMVASGALPLFKDVFKVSSAQYQAFSTLMDLGWSAKPIVGLLSDLVLFRGEHKRGWMVLALTMSVICSAIFVMLPSPPSTSPSPSGDETKIVSVSSEDASFYAKMASFAAICGFFISFGFATVDLLLEGFYCELMQLCPAKSSMLVSWVWMAIMLGGITAALLEGPIADYWNPKVCLVISGAAALLVMIPIVRNWINEERYVRYHRLDATATVTANSTAGAREGGGGSGVCGVYAANNISSTASSSFYGQHGRSNEATSNDSSGSLTNNSIISAPPQQPTTSSCADEVAVVADATASSNTASASAGSSSKQTSTKKKDGSGGVSRNNVVLVEFDTVDDLHAFATRNGHSNNHREREEGMMDGGDDNDVGEEVAAMREREGLLTSTSATLSSGLGLSLRKRSKKERDCGGGGENGLSTTGGGGRRRNRRASSSRGSSSRRGGGAALANTNSYNCVSLCAAIPGCLAAESFLGGCCGSDNSNSGHTRQRSGYMMANTTRNTFYSTLSRAVNMGGGGAARSVSGGGIGAGLSAAVAIDEADDAVRSPTVVGLWGSAPPPPPPLPVTSTFLFLSEKARQHRPIVLYAALMGLTSISMALSTMHFSAASSGDDDGSSSSTTTSTAAAEARDAAILRGRLQLLIVAATAVTLLSATSFFCLPKMIAQANLFMCLKELLYVRIGGPLDYFYTADVDCLKNGPHFSYSYYQSFTAVVGYAAGAFGVSIFYRFFSKRSIRNTFFITTSIKIAASIIDLILVNRWNITYFSKILPYPLSTIFAHDKSVYFFGDAIIFQAVQMMDFMPMVLLTSKMCPKGLECTTYAILAGFSNFGGVLSNTVGSLLIAFVFPIRTTKPSDWVSSSSPSSSSDVKYPNGYCDFSNLPSLLALSHFVMPLVTLVLIPILLPNHRMDEEVLGKEEKEEGDGGVAAACERGGGGGRGNQTAAANSNNATTII